jgi:hypothetical protein
MANLKYDHGDYRAALTGKDGQRVTGPPGKALKIDRFNKGPWKNVVGYRDPVNELEKPHGQWNVVELVNQNGRKAGAF